VIRETQCAAQRVPFELPISLQIPDAVLTGQRYDVEWCSTKPLNGALVAGGIRPPINRPA